MKKGRLIFSKKWTVKILLEFSNAKFHMIQYYDLDFNQIRVTFGKWLIIFYISHLSLMKNKSEIGLNVQQNGQNLFFVGDYLGVLSWCNVLDCIVIDCYLTSKLAVFDLNISINIMSCPIFFMLVLLRRTSFLDTF